MATVANLDVNLRANTRQFSTGMDRASKQTAGFSSKILSLGKKGAGAFIAIGAAAAKVLAKGVFDQFAEIDNLAKQADRLKITTEALAGLRLGAEKSGVEIQTLESSLRRMLRRVSEASQGTGTAAKAIQELGLNAEQLNQLSADQQLKAFADALNQVGNQSDQLRLAFSIFDTEGAKMISLLRSGGQGIDQFISQAKQFGLAVDRESAAGVEAFNDAMADMKAVFTGAFRQIAVAVAPLLTPIIKEITNFIVKGSFIFQNFGDIVSVVFQKLKLNALTFVNDIKHFFTGVLPDAISNFGQLLQEVFSDPLDTGGAFKRFLQRTKESFERELTPGEEALQTDIDKRLGSIQDRWQKFIGNQQQDIANSQNQLQKPIPDLQQQVEVQPKVLEPQSAGAVARGSVAAFSAAEEARRRAQQSREQVRLQHEGNKKLDKLIKLQEQKPDVELAQREIGQ